MNLMVIKARSFARKTGIIRLINRLRSNGAYEERFHQALTRAIKPGDVVWDIGANVGLYTKLFCEWVGKDGLVVAFEPARESFEAIQQQLPDCSWLRVENVALGEDDTTGRLVIARGSVENHIETEVDRTNGSVKSVPVVICRGDTVCERMERRPNVIKVDVEGFEEEVLLGMGNVLSSPELRSVLVEVHFMQLENRGRATAPARIEKMLKLKGFHTNWVDMSHLEAARRPN